MDDLQRVVIERACERTLIRATHLADFEPAGSSAAMFTDECVWDFAAYGIRLTGREALRAHLQRSAPTPPPAPGERRHTLTNVLVDAVDERTATSTAYWAYAAATGPGGLRGISTMGVYRDRLLLTSEGWRIAHREVVLQAAGT